MKMQATISRKLPVIALCSVLLLGACSDMTQREQRVLSGAGIGAATGTVGTVITGGCVSCGAAIGTAVGAGAGYVYDRYNR